MRELYIHVRCNNSGPPFSTFPGWGGAPIEHHSSICSFLLIDFIFSFLSRNVVVKQQKHAASLQGGSGIRFCIYRSSFFSTLDTFKISIFIPLRVFLLFVCHFPVSSLGLSVFSVFFYHISCVPSVFLLSNIFVFSTFAGHYSPWKTPKQVTPTHHRSEPKLSRFKEEKNRLHSVYPARVPLVSACANRTLIKR